MGDIPANGQEVTVQVEQLPVGRDPAADSRVARSGGGVAATVTVGPIVAGGRGRIAWVDGASVMLSILDSASNDSTTWLSMASRALRIVRTARRRSSISIGLAGRFLEDEVRMVRPGDVGGTVPPAPSMFPPNLLNWDTTLLWTRIDGRVDVVGDVRSGVLAVVTAEGRAICDRSYESRTPAPPPLGRTVGAPGEPELDFRSFTPRVAGVRAHHGRVLAVDG